MQKRGAGRTLVPYTVPHILKKGGENGKEPSRTPTPTSVHPDRAGEKRKERQPSISRANAEGWKNRSLIGSAAFKSLEKFSFHRNKRKKNKEDKWARSQYDLPSKGRKEKKSGRKKPADHGLLVY